MPAIEDEAHVLGLAERGQPASLASEGDEVGAIETSQVQFELVAPVVERAGFTSDLATCAEESRLARALGRDTNWVVLHNRELVDAVPQLTR